MKQIFKTVGVLFAVLVGGVLVAAALLPDTFEVRRTATINAPAERVFALINDLHAFNTWNPYDKKDPGMKRTYAGPADGKGATFVFDGDKQVGKGRIEIVDSSPASNVTMSLQMLEPFETTNVVTFTLAPVREATSVTWAMHGRVPYVAKIVHLFVDVDTMVGRDFEAGLASLKSLAERRETASSASSDAREAAR